MPRSTGHPELSVQTRPNGRSVMGVSPLAAFNLFMRVRRISDVPPYGFADRDRRLRGLAYLPGLEPVTAAISSHSQKAQTCSWTLEGPKKTAAQVHGMLHDANFGAGWEDFLGKFSFDFFTQDNGAFIELQGAGDLNGPLTGPVLGLANLDAGRCVRTGDIDYPVIYFDDGGVQHRLHYTRCIFAADMPSPIERLYGRGYCALSRSVAAAQSLFMWSEMRAEFLDDMPPLGVLIFNGIQKEAFNQQYKEYQSGRDKKEQDIYRGLLALFSVGQKIELNFTPFRQTWEGFEDKRFVDTMIDLVAMAFGMDRQELAELTGGQLGSGSQSKTLRKASRGKGLQHLVSTIERMINRVTPQSVTFRFDFSDQDEELQNTQIKQMKANLILSLYTADQPQDSRSVEGTPVATPAITTTNSGLLTYEEARYLLIKEGVLPREIMQESENLNPDWQRFDDVTVKARARYGERVELHKDGKVRYLEPRAFPRPVKFEEAVA